jgi:hypothetical protein
MPIPTPPTTPTHRRMTASCRQRMAERGITSDDVTEAEVHGVRFLRFGDVHGIRGHNGVALLVGADGTLVAVLVRDSLLVLRARPGIGANRHRRHPDGTRRRPSSGSPRPPR